MYFYPFTKNDSDNLQILLKGMNIGHCQFIKGLKEIYIFKGRCKSKYPMNMDNGLAENRRMD